ncbi:unnamed protein product [Pleuronectes platessa]|uniref:Uncharacterized protein n=1 Tax=Pleuronectes platessa TaxID=8262 RepID=A0A9N7VW87_PLEPL|nr:unnamed protein product [Pleuronectes platessa]
MLAQCLCSQAAFSRLPPLLCFPPERNLLSKADLVDRGSEARIGKISVTFSDGKQPNALGTTIHSRSILLEQHELVNLLIIAALEEYHNSGGGRTLRVDTGCYHRSIKAAEAVSPDVDSGMGSACCCERRPALHCPLAPSQTAPCSDCPSPSELSRPLFN